MLIEGMKKEFEVKICYNQNEFLEVVFLAIFFFIAKRQNEYFAIRDYRLVLSESWGISQIRLL